MQQKVEQSPVIKKSNKASALPILSKSESPWKSANNDEEDFNPLDDDFWRIPKRLTLSKYRHDTEEQ